METVINTKTDIWHFFNNAKIIGYNQLNFNDEQKLSLKLECDNLFEQATGCPICPGWWITGFSGMSFEGRFLTF